MDYLEFLKTKIPSSSKFGITESRIPELSPNLMPHQKDIVRWAINGGCRAIFGKFGTGKTVIQLEIIKRLNELVGGKFLIICPLGVKREFQNDCKIVDLPGLKYVKNNQECIDAKTPYLITNYERVRDGDIDLDQFTGVSLDEASVLRGYGTKTFQTFLPKFKNVKYKFVATATPSPNKYKEMIHYAGFLGVMDTGEALTRFFKRDSTKANQLTIHPHKVKEFWMWVNSWAIFMEKPSDLGYSDEGFDLPKLVVNYHRLPVDHTEAGTDSWGQFKMLRDGARSLADAAKEKRDSVGVRVRKAVEIINESPDEHFILWHHIDAEMREIKKQLPESKILHGPQTIELKEQITEGFAEGEFKYLATKPKISGSGCNFQRHCHRAIFVGIDSKFNDFIQAIHRIHRFKQEFPVIIDVIYMETEDSILRNITEKWTRYKKQTETMKEIVKEHGLSDIALLSEIKRSIGIDKISHKGQYYDISNNDNVIECQGMESNSVDLIHTSVPFSNHYEYTPSYNDFGHNVSDVEFFQQMDYLTKELYRVLKPGRIAAIHTKNRVKFGNVTGLGFPTINPFSHSCVFHYMKHGFEFCGEIIVLTDVVRENNQTYRLGWTENSKDSTKMGVGCPEYVLLFRKPQTDKSKGYADDPVKKDKEDYTRGRWQIDASSFWRSSGDRFYNAQELLGFEMNQVHRMYKKYSKEAIYNYEDHINLSNELEKHGRLPATFMLFSPQSWSDQIWSDVTRMHTLNGQQTNKGLENHICPLQFDIVDRIIERFSNPGEIIFDPFGGLMTVPYRAVLAGRYGKGVELNTGYYLDGLSYMRAAEYKKNVPTLFDIVKQND